MGAYSLLAAIYPAQHVYYLENGVFAKDFKKLNLDFPYDDGGENNWDFTGNNFQWHKCGDFSCLSAYKTYKNGVYGLQVYFEEHADQNTYAGEIICFADFDDNALEMCKFLGYSNTPFASGTPTRRIGKIKYYKKL